MLPLFLTSFSITFICLSPWTLAKHFTTPSLSRTSDAVTFLTSCSSSAISSSELLIKTVSSDCKTSEMLFPRHYRHSTRVGSAAGSDVIIFASKSIYSSSVVSLQICANNSWNSVQISSFMIDLSPTSNPHFLKHCLVISMDTHFQAVWSQVIVFNTCTSSIIWEAIFPSLIPLTAFSDLPKN